MTSMPAQGGWVLERVTNDDIDQLMAWFPDAKAVKVWGGPHFRYPFSRDWNGAEGVSTIVLRG